jgi:hypothetical protein
LWSTGGTGIGSFSTAGVDADDSFVVHVHHVFDEHPEVRPLQDLPPEWAAERESPRDEWRRYPWPDEPE